MPKSLSGRNEDNNNLLLETTFENRCKFNYRENEYAVIVEMVYAVKNPAELYNPSAALSITEDEVDIESLVDEGPAIEHGLDLRSNTCAQQPANTSGHGILHLVKEYNRGFHLRRGPWPSLLVPVKTMCISSTDTHRRPTAQPFRRVGIDNNCPVAGT